ncbi:MAG TPA: hypothetical protein VGD48_09285 [Kutzneria sp.]|jgi:hypothetical protein
MTGAQPDGQGVGHPTAQGFDSDLAHGLKLTELGCPAETKAGSHSSEAA